MSIIYASVHIPSAIAWGAVTGILAMLPFIGYFAVAAVCVSQLAHERQLLHWLARSHWICRVILHRQFVRPMLMAKGARLHFL